MLLQQALNFNTLEDSLNKIISYLVIGNQYDVVGIFCSKRDLNKLIVVVKFMDGPFP